MAFDIINPQNLFLRDLGLKYLYLPAGLPKFQASEKTASQMPQTKPQSAVPKVAQAPRVSEAGEQAIAQKTRQTTRPPAFTPLPVEDWPASWQTRLKKTSPGKVVWTYWQLGADVLGIDNEEAKSRDQRRSFLQQLIRELGQPKGTHTFWPMSLPDEGGEYRANPLVFWSGVKSLNSRSVVILGSAAARPLVPGKKLHPLDEFRMNGQLVWILRDIDPLLNSRTWYQMTLAFLKNALSNYLRTR